MAHLALCLSAFRARFSSGLPHSQQGKHRKRVCPRQHPSWWLDAGKIFSIAKPDKSHTPHPSYLMACFSAMKPKQTKWWRFLEGWTARKSEVVAMKLDVLIVNCLSQTTQEKTQEFWHPTNTKLQNVLPWSWSVPRGSIAILQDFRHKISVPMIQFIVYSHSVRPEV